MRCDNICDYIGFQPGAVEEAVEETQLYKAGGSELSDGETPQDGWNSDRSMYYEGGVPKTGLFKATMKNDVGALFYADENGNVNYTEGPLLVENSLFVLVEDEQGHKGFQEKEPSDNYTYLFKKISDGDVVALEKGETKQTVNGSDYYLQANGTVRTNAGAQLIEGSYYYIIQGGVIQKTVGFSPDHKYYVNDSTGKLRTSQGTFKANDGKTYYSGNGGVIPSKEGLYSVGSTQYYVYSDGSVKTDAGFITVGGRKYLVNAGGAISKSTGPVTFGGKIYVAEPGGAIHTTPGFYKAGGKIYYVADNNGVLKVNSAFKVSGKTYHVPANGIIAVGVHKWGNFYYYSNAGGDIRTKAGIVTWNGNYYHVKKGGKLSTNKKVTYKKKKYIAGANAVIYRGIFT